MTSLPPNTTPEPPNNRRNLLRGLLQIARRPWAIAIAVTSITVGVAGCVGLRFFVYQKLPPLLEEELSQIMNREVRVGEVKSFSLTSIQLGPASIPATPTDPDNVSIRSIEVGFNPLPLLLRRPLPLSITLVDVDAYADQDE
ncbi:MAG: hypothetical protein AB4426_10910, partial [Xenococcaceae cyanobacterium]